MQYRLGGVFWGVTKKTKSGDLGLQPSVLSSWRSGECNGECWEGRSVDLGEIKMSIFCVGIA